MPLEVREFEDTPNPNALKCVLDRAAAAVGNTTRSYRSPDAAANDPLAQQLFGIEGVTTVLIGDGWLTVNKRPDAEWKKIKVAVRDVLRKAE